MAGLADFNMLRFPIPEPLLTTYNTAENADLFDAENSHLILYVQPGGYRPVWTATGETSLVDGYGSTVVQTAKWRYGFDVATIEGRTAPYEIIRTLAQTAAAVKGQYSAIAVWDYVNPEPGDAAATGYTVRNTRLENIQPSGTIRADSAFNSARYSQGFQFRLVEIEARSQY